MTNQHLTVPSLTAVEVVAAFGAMQAQEYEHAKWAVGVRAPDVTHVDIERLLVDGEILRSHPMRGTHHFVARADLRWLMALMGPLMIARSARRNRELDLDEKTLTKAMKALARVLETGEHLTRAEVADVMKRANIATDGQRLPHIIYRAELESIACSGKRKGKQITLAAFDQRVRDAKPKSREDSLRELARRYFTTRAPATLKDFTWWCQLPAGDARAAVELAGIEHDGTYYGPRPRARKPPRALLLAPYDEYTVSYVDRSAAGAAPVTVKGFFEKGLLAPNIVIEGKVAGTWRRTVRGKTSTVELSLWRKLSATEYTALNKAMTRYQSFYLPQSL